MDDHKHTLWTYLSPAALLSWVGLLTMLVTAYFLFSPLLTRLDRIETNMVLMQERVVLAAENIEAKIGLMEKATVLFFEVERRSDDKWQDSEDKDFDNVGEILRDLRADSPHNVQPYHREPGKGAMGRRLTAARLETVGEPE